MFLVHVGLGQLINGYWNLPWLSDQWILKSPLIIDCKSTILVMLIIPKRHPFGPVSAIQQQRMELLVIKWKEFPVLIDLIDLITSTDYRFEASDNQNLSQFPALCFFHCWYFPPFLRRIKGWYEVVREASLSEEQQQQLQTSVQAKFQVSRDCWWSEQTV